MAVEVKTRRGEEAPEQAVTDARLDRLERALRALAPSLRPRPRALRVDVVAVVARPDGSLEVRAFPGEELEPPHR